ILRQAVNVLLQHFERPASAPQFKFTYFFEGAFALKLSPFFSTRGRFSVRDIVTNVMTGAFTLDCIHITGTAVPFIKGVADLSRARQMLTGYLTVLKPELEKHRDEMSWKGAWTNSEKGEPRLRFQFLEASITYPGLIKDAYESYPGLFAIGLMLDIHME